MISRGEIHFELNLRRILAITLFFGIFFAITYTYILGLLAFDSPSQDVPLRFNQVSTLDNNNISTSDLGKGNIVRINSTVEMALRYELSSVYYDFTSPVTYRIIISVIDPNKMAVNFNDTQKTISRGDIQNTFFDYKIATNAVTGSYTVRVMLWSDWLPSGTTLTSTAEEVTFNVS